MLVATLLAVLLRPTLAQVPPIGPDETLVFEDTFDDFNFSVWRHEQTLSGGGNWEFGEGILMQ